jgi:hypothetical protein
VHPAFATGEEAYVPGWRTETFASVDGDWPEPMPWYFRTVAAWVHDLSMYGFTIDAVREPMDARQFRPLSMIFVCRVSLRDGGRS